MKSHWRFLCILGFGLALLLSGLSFQGCATTRQMDWNTRIGNCTYDQAVAELGPPDKTAKLSDGSTVADWVTRRSGGGAFSIGVGSFGSHTGVGVGQTVGTGARERVLRLTFGPDGQLTDSNQRSR